MDVLDTKGVSGEDGIWRGHVWRHMSGGHMSVIDMVLNPSTKILMGTVSQIKRLCRE